MEKAKGNEEEAEDVWRGAEEDQVIKGRYGKSSTMLPMEVPYLVFACRKVPRKCGRFAGTACVSGAKSVTSIRGEGHQIVPASSLW